MLPLYTYLQSYFATRQTKLTLAIWLSHQLLFYCNKTENVIYDVWLCLLFMTRFKTRNVNTFWSTNVVLLQRVSE